jgi:hypothetical protein
LILLLLFLLYFLLLLILLSSKNQETPALGRVEPFAFSFIPLVLFFLILLLG